MTRGGAGRAETPSARTGRDADHHDGAGRNAVLAIEVSQRHGGVAAVRLGNGAPVGAAAPRLGNGASIGAAAPGPEIVGIAVGPPNPDRDRLMPAI
ncbi:MAG: hypothetical protein FJ253_09465, partial [Phycisphaerae bacterium]|nr:hypothetical protein [Phycisphaerae bacterium]